MALYAGTIENYGGSMAEAIECAFKREWPNVMGPGTPASDPQFRLLCVAIAQGVVHHLVQHPEAFEVKVNIGEWSFNGAISILHQEPLY